MLLVLACAGAVVFVTHSQHTASLLNYNMKDWQDLEELLKLPRQVVTLNDYKMNINLGAGNMKKTSVREL